MDNNKIVGNNCFGLITESNEGKDKWLFKYHYFYEILSKIYNINVIIFNILMENNYLEGVYNIGNNLKIEFFNVKYTSTEFKIFTDDPNNSIVSGKIGLGGCNDKDLSFDYYKPDVLNIDSIDLYNDSPDNLLSKYDTIRLLQHVLLLGRTEKGII